MHFLPAEGEKEAVDREHAGNERGGEGEVEKGAL
jgi:hypothetical protein